MNPSQPPPEFPPECLVRLRPLLDSGRRHLVGLVGPPGVGKSTLARLIVDSMPSGLAQLVPMDGFHLANAELARLGRGARKGAPDTFDSAGYVALLRRLRDQGADEVVYAPAFHREIEEPVAGAIAVLPGTRLVITEGNYLLLDRDGWGEVAALLDECWYVDGDADRRRERLRARHRQFGRSPEQAADWVVRTDEPNARLIESTRARAGLVVRWG